MGFGAISTAIRAAIGVAETSLAAALVELRPGVSERELTGVFVHKLGEPGSKAEGSNPLYFEESDGQARSKLSYHDISVRS